MPMINSNTVLCFFRISMSSNFIDYFSNQLFEPMFFHKSDLHMDINWRCRSYYDSWIILPLCRWIWTSSGMGNALILQPSVVQCLRELNIKIFSTTFHQAVDISPNPGRSDPMYVVYSRKLSTAWKYTGEDQPICKTAAMVGVIKDESAVWTAYYYM